MRKMIPLLLLLCIGVGSINAQKKEKFEDFIELKGVKAIVITKNMFNLIPEKAIGDSDFEFSSIMRKIDSLIVLKNDNNEQGFKNLKPKVDKYIKDSKIEPILFTKDDDSNTSIYFNDAKSNSELIVYKSGESNISVFRLIGGFTLKEIQDIINK